MTRTSPAARGAEADDDLRLWIDQIGEPEKFRQMVLFFLHEMGPLSFEHLTYLIYMADFDHMEQHRESITKAHYYKGRPS